ncbi:unannotated protein [freshwater metagenome]|uniref:Unannotated protein n=1 Tax=freshwater metagenome TaxID=449393 RepID=A0A6J6I9R3_9ZZZZ
MPTGIGDAVTSVEVPCSYTVHVGAAAAVSEPEYPEYEGVRVGVDAP